MKLGWIRKLDDRWELYPSWVKTFHDIRLIMFAICVIVCMSAMFRTSDIESEAFRQPTSAGGIYPYPVHIKSELFYLSAEQYQTYRWAGRLSFGSWLLGFILIFGGNAFIRRFKRDDKESNR